MKKILFTLFAVLCAVQLYGMNEPKKQSPIESLLPELKKEIVKTALATSDNLDDTIKAINVANALQGVKYDKLKDFTTLMHILADKFDITTAEVADKFNTPIAQTYKVLGYNLLDFAGDKSQHDKISELIKKGADVNFRSYKTPLELAISAKDTEGVKILIEFGAKPTSENLQLIDNMDQNDKRVTLIKKFLKDATQK